MPVIPIDFLNSAQKENEHAEEIHSRNAISRAYYSAYHSALTLNDMIPDHPGIASNTGVHEQFLTKLTNCKPSLLNGDKALSRSIQSVGYCLKQARTARHKADYKLSTDVQKEEAEAQIELAKKIFEKVSESAMLLSSCKVMGSI